MTESARDVVERLAKKAIAEHGSFDDDAMHNVTHAFARSLLLWAAESLRNSQKQIKDGSIAHLFDLNQHECAAILEAKAGELK